MALRLPGRRTISVLISRSSWLPGESPAAVRDGLPKPRSASSSSSSPSSYPSRRDKKMTTDRLSTVIDAVNDRKLPPELRGQRNASRLETDIINVVEQRVWHAMEEGQFENLSGKGKPLNLSSNHHVDRAEDTLYRILNKNGCVDDLIFTGNDETMICEFKNSMMREFDMSDLGRMRYFLGIGRMMVLKYAMDVLKRLGMGESNSLLNHIVPGTKLCKRCRWD